MVEQNLPLTPRQQAFVAVTGWIEERLGKEAAHLWAWSCTCYPFGPLSDEMLAQGLAVATGELELDDLRAHIWNEMGEALRKFREQEADAGVQQGV